MSITTWKDLRADFGGNACKANEAPVMPSRSPDYKEVIIEERIEYGTKRYYPTNELGKKFASLLGKKTLTNEALSFIVKELEIPVNFKPNEIKF